MIFQSAIGGVLNPFADCEHAYLSVLVGYNLSTEVNNKNGLIKWTIYPNPTYEKLQITLKVDFDPIVVKLITSLCQQILNIKADHIRN